MARYSGNYASRAWEVVARRDAQLRPNDGAANDASLIKRHHLTLPSLTRRAPPSPHHGEENYGFSVFCKLAIYFPSPTKVGVHCAAALRIGDGC